MEKVPANRLKLRVLIGLSGILVLACGIVLNYVYGDLLREQVVTSINARLKTKAEVQDIDFTIFSSFPYAAVRFSEVLIREPEGVVSNGTLLKAGRISFRFRLWDLFTGNVQLTGVEVADGQINLYKDAKGLVNYDILKEDTASNQGGLHIDLQRIDLHNFSLNYLDKFADQHHRFSIVDAQLSGALSQSVFAARLNGVFDSISVRVEEITYLDQKPAEINVSFSADTDKGHFVIESSSFELAGMNFGLKGDWSSQKTYEDVDFSFASKDADIPSLITLLPVQLTKGFSKFNCTGDVAFNGRFYGRYGNGATPVFSVDFIARNATANPEGSSYKITELNGAGSFTSRKSNAAPYESLTLKSITAKLEGAPFKLNMRLDNFQNPNLDLSLQLDADLAILSEFYLPDTVDDVSGRVSADISFNGLAKEKNSYKSNGTIRLNDVSFKMKGSQLHYGNINGTLHLRENDMVLESLSCKIGASDLQITGGFNNLMGYFLIENQKVDVQATLQSQFLDLDEFLGASSSVEDSSSITFTRQHRLALELNISQLKFRKFQATNFKGDMVVEDAKLISSGLRFNSCGGEIKITGSVDGQPSDFIRISCNSQIRNVDITSLFQQMGNFGQTTLIDKNLKGRLAANVDLQAQWDKQLSLDESSVVAQSDISIDNGELIRFKPMLALSKYLKGSDLEIIRFSNLTNTIEIRDRKIIIPVMDIRSSALDLTASGTHSFDNIVDYKLGLYLSQFLGKKVKQMNTEFGTIEDDGLGRPRIYLSMKGPAADPKFTWDRKGTEQRISDEIRKERNTIRDLLRKEFGKQSDREKSSEGVPAPKSQTATELELETDE